MFVFRLLILFLLLSANETNAFTEIPYILFAPSPCADTANQDTVYQCLQTSTPDTIWYVRVDLTTCDWLDINIQTGEILGTPNASQVGSCNFAYTKIDASPVEQEFELTVTVTNASPTLSLSNESINEDSSVVILKTDAQVEANEEIFGLGAYSLDRVSVTAPGCDINGDLNINVLTGSISFTSNDDYNGVCNIKVVYDDGFGDQVSAEFSVNILPINDMPEVSYSGDLALLEDTGLSVSTIVDDPDSDTIIYSFGPSHNCSWVSLDLNTGVLSGTPNDDDVGSCSLSVLAFDGTINSIENVVTVSVLNRRPFLVLTNEVLSNVGAPLTVIKTDLQVQASDEGFGVYSLDLPGSPDVACQNFGVLSIDPSTGEIQFDPDNAYQGVCIIRVIFDDQNLVDNIGFDDFSLNVGTTDTTPPAIVITFPSDPITDVVNSSNATNYTVTGTCSDLGINVSVDFSIFNQTVPCQMGGVFNATFNLATLPDALSYLVRATQTDLAGNVGFDEFFISKDTTATDAMTLTLLSPASNEGTDASITIEVTGLPNDWDSVNYFSDSGCTSSYASITNVSSGTNSTQDQVSSLVSCTQNIVYSQYTDANGNVSPCSSSSINFLKFGNSRVLTLAPATDQNELQVELNLTTSNFDFSNVEPDLSDLRFFESGTSNVLNHWVERLDFSDETKIWIQIPTAGSTNIDMIYCQDSVNTVEDRIETFSYTAPVANYVELLGGDISVFSYSDNNTITVGGSPTQILQERDFVTFSGSVAGDVVSSDRPIAGRVLDQSGFDSIVPFSFSGTEFGYPTSRGTDRWSFYNPGAVDANITVTSYNSAGAVNNTFGLTVAAFSTNTITYSGALVSDVVSSVPVLAYYKQGTSDATPALPASFELYGVSSGDGYYSTMVSGANISLFSSGGGTTNVTANRGQRFQTGFGGSQGTGDAIRLVSDQPIFGASQADSDGLESVSFTPIEHLDSYYGIGFQAQYATFACPYSTVIDVISPAGLPVVSLNCNAISPFPGKAIYAPGVNIPEGTSFIANQIFYIYVEYLTVDETLVIGPKNSRLFSPAPPIVSVGAEINH